MSRPTLATAVVDRIRRERLQPHPRQVDYLHLSALKKALGSAFASIPARPGPLLDLYCGTKPYLELTPWRPHWGLDLDLHFGRADVVGSVPLPFREGTFSVVLCTQAFHLVDDPALTATEMARVLAPSGYAIVTVPHLFRKEIPAERKLGTEDLSALFGGWSEVSVAAVGGPGSGLLSYPGGLLAGAARRWPALRALLPPAGLALTALGISLNALLAPFASRWPDSLILVARRSDS